MFLFASNSFLNNVRPSLAFSQHVQPNTREPPCIYWLYTIESGGIAQNSSSTISFAIWYPPGQQLFTQSSLAQVDTCRLAKTDLGTSICPLIRTTSQLHYCLFMLGENGSTPILPEGSEYGLLLLRLFTFSPYSSECVRRPNNISRKRLVVNRALASCCAWSHLISVASVRRFILLRISRKA